MAVAAWSVQSPTNQEDNHLLHSFSRPDSVSSTLRFWEIAANVSELPWPFQQPPLPLLPFFSGCRWITESIDLFARQVDGLRYGFGASPRHRPRSCKPQLDKSADGFGPGWEIVLLASPLIDGCQE
jgi:hypothetical protein